MSGNSPWNDLGAGRAEGVSGEAALAEGRREPLPEALGHRLAEIRRARGLTQEQVAERMGVTKSRVSQIEQGKISGQDVLSRYATALGGRLHQAIYFANGDISTIA
ncbi:helix-turn-helix protein [Actinocorallia herbida]|uniref:Helix-turn-helix protein n=1 Tax=Actinocorallia herbida TaxID=58109 RepID=A0A3N1CY07_9ACTN|nr:helix-turn-helix transcriptional regulator [Actinocorallia herbida]ROO86180.1 helix-turn-helix protein [Actinocorallia herbida]